jgi:hypothetical protein
MANHAVQEARAGVKRLLLREPEACQILGISRTALRSLMAQ